MKEKHKSRLSGHWWYPVRKFSLVADLSQEDVISKIETLHTPHWSSRGIFVGSKSNEFFIRDDWGGLIFFYVKGEISVTGSETHIHGKAGIGYLFVHVPIAMIILGYCVALVYSLLSASVLYSLLYLFGISFFSLMEIQLLKEIPKTFGKFVSALQVTDQYKRSTPPSDIN